MKRILLCLITCGIFALFFLISSQEVYAEYVPGEVLVKYKANASSEEIGLLHTSMGTVSKRNFKKINIQQMKIPDYMSVEEAVNYYEQDPNVEYAEPNYIVHATALPPGDPSYTSLWGLNNTGQTIRLLMTERILMLLKYPVLPPLLISGRNINLWTAPPWQRPMFQALQD